MNYGNVKLIGGKWRIETAPHVMVRLKRVFERIDKRNIGVAWLEDTVENGRELAWFLERYPMEVDPRDYLEQRVSEHKEQEQRIDRLLSGDYTPQAFELAIPARDYQKIAADIVLNTGRLLLADEVGLGKSCSAICTLTDPETLPALVVTLTHLPRQWDREIGRFLPKLRTHIIKKGTPYDITAGKRGKRELFPDVIIMNYHKLSGWADTLKTVVRSIIYDEVQELRHPDTAKYNAAELLTSCARYRMALSATPIHNYGGEFFHVMQCIAPDALGTYSEFEREWCEKGFGIKPKIKDPQAFGAFLRQSGLMLRRTRQDVKRELPDVTIIPHTIDANLEELQKVESSAAELARIILAQQGETRRGEKMHAAADLSWMLRRATGVAKASYVAEFVKMLLDQDEKVVLYGWHREVYAMWEELFADYQPAFYTGTESANQKEEAKRRFVDGETPLLIISLRSGAGLDGLQQVCRTVVFGELDWSPSVHHQDIGRIHRDGQKDPVTAYYLISDHGSDPVIADVLQLKKQQLDGVINPDADLIEELQVDPDNIKRLAERYLKARLN